MKATLFSTFWLLALAGAVGTPVPAGMQSSSYRINSSVISSSGVDANSGSYQMEGTVGQPSPLMDPDDPPWSSGYDLYPGFWYTLAGIAYCDGDFDLDGDVDGSDLALFSGDFGRTDCAVGPVCEGDFDSDDDVDGTDLAKFSSNFGRVDCPSLP